MDPATNEVKINLKELESGVTAVLHADDQMPVFSETPVPLLDFLHSKNFLGLRTLSPKQLEFISYGTQIYKDDDLKLLGWTVLRRVGELVAWWGKGSGKDFVSQIIQCRIAYQLLCLTSPQRYFDKADVTSIDMLNMAYNADQANSVFFRTFCEMINACRWFNNKCEIKKSMVQFDKRVAAYSGHAYEESFEGKNLMLAVLDEISAFKTKLEVERLAIRRLRTPRYSAEAVYDMAKSSIESRFSNGIGKIISLSFSRFQNDYIQQLYEAGKDEPTCFVSFGTTWEVNPNRSREDFNDEFRKNPERAHARYGCSPVGVEGGFFKNRDVIIRAFPLMPDSLVPTTDDYFPAIKPNFKCLHSYACSIHIDLGLRHDKAGICMSHVAGHIPSMVQNEQGEKSETELPVVKVDLLTSFMATSNSEIDFSLIRTFIMELINRGFIIGKLTLDSWNSVDFIQIMSKFGIESDVRSVDKKTDAYDCLKELIYDGRIRGYSYLRSFEVSGSVVRKNELMDEMFQLIFDGRKVEHTAYSSKDLSDALAGSVQGAVELGFDSFTVDDVHEGVDKETTLGSEYVADREYLRPITDEYFSDNF